MEILSSGKGDQPGLKWAPHKAIAVRAGDGTDRIIILVCFDVLM